MLYIRSVSIIVRHTIPILIPHSIIVTVADNSNIIHVHRDISINININVYQMSTMNINNSVNNFDIIFHFI